MPLNGFAVVIRIQKVLQRLKGHPVSAALFLNASGTQIHQTGVFKTIFAHPAQQGVHRRQIPDIGHLGIAPLGHQGHALWALNHQCFQHQLATGAQQFSKLTQVVHRRAAVVENAHRENRIKGRQLGRHMFYTQRQHINRQVGPGKILDRLKLKNKFYRRINTNYPPCTRTEHTPAVVAIAAANIQNQSIFKAVQMGGNPIPFPVRSPFSIYWQPKQVVRTFAPGVQSHQSGLQCQAAAFVHQASVANGDFGCKFYFKGVYLRQAPQGLFPFWHIAPALTAQLLGQKFRQRLTPVAERGLFQPGEEWPVIKCLRNHCYACDFDRQL